MVLRASQLDSLQMEANIARIIFRSCQDLLRAPIDETWGLTLVRFIIWYLTVWRGKPTPGMRLQNLVHADGRALAARERFVRKLLSLPPSETDEGPSLRMKGVDAPNSLDLTKPQRVAFLLLTLLPVETLLDIGTKVFYSLQRKAVWSEVLMRYRSLKRMLTGGPRAEKAPEGDDEEHVEFANESTEETVALPEIEDEEEREFQRRMLVSKLKDWAEAASFVYSWLFVANLVKYVTPAHAILRISFVPLQVGAKRLMAQEHMCLMLLFSQSSNMLLELLPLLDLRGLRKSAVSTWEDVRQKFLLWKFRLLRRNSERAHEFAAGAVADEPRELPPNQDGLKSTRSDARPPVAAFETLNKFEGTANDADTAPPSISDGGLVSSSPVADTSRSTILSHGGAHSIRTRDRGLVARWKNVLLPGTRRDVGAPSSPLFTNDRKSEKLTNAQRQRLNKR